MKSSRQLLSLAALALAPVLFTPQAKGSFIMNISQSGSNVVGTGSGTLNLAALTFAGDYGSNGGEVWGHIPIGGSLADLGPPASPKVAGYTGATGPSSFGTGGDHVASSGSGNPAGLNSDFQGIRPYIFVPEGYVSGSSLSDTSTWDGTTLAALGLTVGTYTYTWGTGATADSLTLNIGPAAPSVPEPGSLCLLATGGAALLFQRWRKRA